MLRNIEDILKHCETCKKQTSTPILPKSVIPCDNGKPYKQWAINVIGPMPVNSQGKRFIITGITSELAGPMPKQYPNTLIFQ